jgi:DNA-binding LacI/PurR family transcriptional regulator
MAMGVLSACGSAAAEVPDDVSVVGCDAWPSPPSWPPADDRAHPVRANRHRAAEPAGEIGRAEIPHRERSPVQLIERRVQVPRRRPSMAEDAPVAYTKQGRSS